MFEKSQITKHKNQPLLSNFSEQFFSCPLLSKIIGFYKVGLDRSWLDCLSFFSLKFLVDCLIIFSKMHINYFDHIYPSLSH
jgi:hypothetical protein